MNDKAKARIKLLSALTIFGTLGIFTRYLPVPSALLALARGFIGVIFLLVIMLLTKSKLSWVEIKRNLTPLLISGFFLGFNWIFLFEAYRYTTVPTATLCYYLAPILVVIATPIVFKGGFSLKKLICVFVALLGMVGVSGVIETGLPSIAEFKGIGFGTLAAVLYATILLLNKKITGLSSYERTVIQLGTSAIVLLPYCLATGQFEGVVLTPYIAVMLLVAGIVYTGFAYYLYFGSMEILAPQSIAILGYIDPIVALALSAVILGEHLSLWGMVGAVMILGSALISELPEKQARLQSTKSS